MKLIPGTRSNGRPNLPMLVIVLSVLAVVPPFLRDNRFYLHIIIIAMIWAVVAVYWDLVLGYGGVFSWGQIAFFVLGAYGTGMVTLHLAWSPWIGLLVGAAVAGVAALVLGLPTLKLSGVHVGLVTFVVHLTMGPLIVLAKPWGTGGTLGLLGIPPFSFGDYTFNAFQLIPWYYLAWLLLTTSSLLVFVFLRSSYGMALTAIRDAEPFAQSIGVSAYRLKLGVFVFSAVLTGFAGAFYAQYTSSISPRLLGLDIFLTVIAMLVLGGIGRYPGAVVGAIIVAMVTEVLRPLETYRLLVFGAVVVVAVITMPSGLMGLLDWLQGAARSVVHRSRLPFVRRTGESGPDAAPKENQEL